MNPLTDQQLLTRYAGDRTETAFAELLRRHVDFVYSAAVRMVRDTHLAEDVTQGVFVALAQNARQLTDRPVLAGWLHRTTQNLAANAVRADVRRRVREQEAAAMNEIFATDTAATWEHIGPQLDAALGELTEPDRDALLLRYFERKSAAEMAQLLGISDEAAQKRVNRAVERLRDSFAKHGVTVGASGLVAVISAHAVQAAPAGLLATISAAAVFAGTAASTSTVIATTKTLAMTTLPKTFVTFTVAVLAGAVIYELHQADRWHERVQTLQQQQAPLAEQVRQLQRERNDATNQLAAWLQNNDPKRLRKEHLELLSLRGRVTQMATELRERKSAGTLGDSNPNPQPNEKTADSILLTATLATNSVVSGNSLLVGGWSLLDRRGYLLITPAIVPDNPSSGERQITIQGQIIQAPESFWDDIGWGTYKSATRRSTLAGELTSEQVRLLLQALKETKDAVISRTPPETIPDGERRGYGFSRQEDDGSGGALMGVDFYPRISADGHSVSIEIIPTPVAANVPIHPALKSK